jgi:hypothetical protein
VAGEAALEDALTTHGIGARDEHHREQGGRGDEGRRRRPHFVR